MNFFPVFFILWTVFFTCDCQSSTEKCSEKTDITTCNDNACGSISGNCTTVTLNQGDYLLVSEDKLFVKPLSLTVNNSSYVNNNGMVAVCECLFCRRETSVSQNGSCNLTIHDCPKISLDRRDVLHLSDGTVFVKSLNMRLNDSAYGIVNGSVVACECLNKDLKAYVFNNTCKFIIDKKTSIATNCNALSLEPMDYNILSNDTVHVLKWNLTLNVSYFSVENGLMTACSPDCYSPPGFWMQLINAATSVLVLDLPWSLGYSVFPTFELNKMKRVFVLFFYFLSSLFALAHFTFAQRGSYDLLVMLFTQLSFSGVMGYGMLTITSSPDVIKFLQWTGVLEETHRGPHPKKYIFMATFYWFCLFMPFVIAYYFHYHLHPSRFIEEDIVPASDYYFSEEFRNNIPLPYMEDVIYMLILVIDIILLMSPIWEWYLPFNYDDHQPGFWTYLIHLVIFMLLALIWTFELKCLKEDELFKGAWPFFVINKLLVSGALLIFVSEHSFDATVQYCTSFMR